ncbi:hypothetical protein C8R47DRAFT_1251768, partial [Mycena vitilis]
RRPEIERASLRRYIERCHSVSSPIRRLPTELLVDIFASCSPKASSFYHPMKPIPTNRAEMLAQLHLLRLSQVCISWYHTVMGSPQVWATLHVIFGRHGVNNKRAVSLSRSLALSAGCPLDIHCVVSPADNALGLQMLAAQSARWRSLDLYLSESTTESLADVKGNLPLLESVGYAVPALLPCTIELHTLNLSLANGGEADQQEIFGEILAKVTLLGLRQLAIRHSDNEPLLWPTYHFLSSSASSAITTPPTWSLGSRISHFALHFRRYTFLDFVASRLVAGRAADVPFSIETMACPDAAGRDFAPFAVADMLDLVDRGQLRWSRTTEEDIRLRWA